MYRPFLIQTKRLSNVSDGKGTKTLVQAGSARFSCHGNAIQAPKEIKVKRPQRDSAFQISSYFLILASQLWLHLMIQPPSFNKPTFNVIAAYRVNTAVIDILYSYIYYIYIQYNPTDPFNWTTLMSFSSLWPPGVCAHLSMMPGQRHDRNVDHPDTTQKYTRYTSTFIQGKSKAHSLWHTHDNTQDTQNTVHSLSLYQQNTMNKLEEMGRWSTCEVLFRLSCYLEFWLRGCPLVHLLQSTDLLCND